ncbi:outer membrane lipoprotein carrier protein LolA [Herbaspirillum sp. HC18]|nr:outer membrane lipoprotein carrier protein LolA [Herbaspirillum sp. HC18]
MRFLIFLMLVVCSASTMAAPSAADLSNHFSKRLEQHPVLRADFVQEKQMAAFKKPLVTRGRLVFVRGEGVIWQIESPLKLIYVLGDDRIVEIGEDGKANVRSAKDVPGIAHVGRIFRALLGAQTNAIADGFTAQADGSMDAWRITLAPRPGPVGQFIRQIQLSGTRYVDRVVIDEPSGDKAVIVFRNTSEHESPSAEERRLFGVRQ